MIFNIKMDTVQALRGKLDPDYIVQNVKFQHQFRKEHPDYFQPDGLIVFTGLQGTGKTLSAVQYVTKLLDEYPKARLVSNVDVIGYEYRTVPFDGVSRFKTEKNGEYGIIFLIDEIQLLFNSLESKGMDVNLFETICQQRKQRVHIVGTTQVFGRLAKGFREQFKFVVECKQVFKWLQFNRYAKGVDCIAGEDGHFEVTKSHLVFWFVHPNMYSLYDTTAVIDRSAFNFKWDFNDISNDWGF